MNIDSIAVGLLQLDQVKKTKRLLIFGDDKEMLRDYLVANDRIPPRIVKSSSLIDDVVIIQMKKANDVRTDRIAKYVEDFKKSNPNLSAECRVSKYTRDIEHLHNPS